MAIEIDKWETILEECNSSGVLNCRQFGRILQTVGPLLKEELAPFEVDWILNTFLYRPVNTLNVISSMRNDDSWCKVLGEAFKLLSEIVTHHGHHMQNHFQSIVEVCLLTYDAKTRSQSLACLTNIAKISDLAGMAVGRHISSLEEGKVCKAPLIILIGTICEYHPELVEREVLRIWRLYLNLLDSDKFTNVVTNAVYHGMLGLFKHFGRQLPTAELDTLYLKMSSSFIYIANPDTAFLKILDRHTDLFPERLIHDSQLRIYLWLHVEEGRNWYVPRIRSVYNAIMTHAHKKQTHAICNTELRKQIRSNNITCKLLALRIYRDLMCIKSPDIVKYVDDNVQTLEFKLRSGDVTQETVETVSWWIEVNGPESDKLIQTAILFYTNIPTSKRKEVIIQGIRIASPDVKTAAITFLVTESCQLDDTSMQKYLPIWSDLFHLDDINDHSAREQIKCIFNEFMVYVLFVLKTSLDEVGYDEKPPEKLLLLFRLIHQVLELVSPDWYTAEPCQRLQALVLRLAGRCGLGAAALAAATAACRHHAHRATGDYYTDLCGIIRLRRCRDEALFFECCIALVQNTESYFENISEETIALEVIFSRNDVDLKVLSRALTKLEFLILHAEYKDEERINRIINLVGRLRTRMDLTGVEARKLHRDVLLFIGKFGKNETRTDVMPIDNSLFVELKDRLMLSLPNATEGTDIKINLNRILQLALIDEEPNALHTLLTMIYTELTICEDVVMQRALVCVVCVLCGAHVRGAAVDSELLERALLKCSHIDCVMDIMKFIITEKSPGVKKMVSDALEGVIRQNHTGLDINDTLKCVFLQVEMNFSSRNNIENTAGLDIMENLLSIIETIPSYQSLKELLPKIMLLILRAYRLDTQPLFTMATNIYINSINLFAKNQLNSLRTEMLKILLENNEDLVWNHNTPLNVAYHKMAEDFKLYKKAIKMVVDFFVKLNNLYIDIGVITSVQETPGYAGNMYCQKLRILIELKNLGLQSVDNTVLMLLDGVQLDWCNVFHVETFLEFLEVYADLILQSKKTLHIGTDAIVEVEAKFMKHLHNRIISCFTTYRRKWESIPSEFTYLFEEWCKRWLKLARVSENLEDVTLVQLCDDSVSALKTILDTGINLDFKYNIDLYVTAWPWYVVKLLENGLKMTPNTSELLSDVMYVSLKKMAERQVKSLIMAGYCDGKVWSGLTLCRQFIGVFSDYFVGKPYLLTAVDSAPCSVILSDIVKYYLKRKCSDDLYDGILKMADEIWPTYIIYTNYEEIYSLFRDLTSLPKKLCFSSSPIKWAIETLKTMDDRPNEKTDLIGLLPGGEEYSALYRTFTNCLPTQVSESDTTMYDRLRKVLDALAATGDLTLLEIVIALAGGDDKNGWWDEALNSCMASLALKNNINICTAAYRKCMQGMPLPACSRILVPLLRYSSTSICKEFFSKVLHFLLITRSCNAAGNVLYKEFLVDCTRKIMVLQVALEKIPISYMESPTSPLYSELQNAQPWHLIRQSCKILITLRSHIQSMFFKEETIVLQCAIYNCLCTAISLRLPQSTSIFRTLFGREVWNLLIDKDATYNLNLEQYWNQRTIRHAVQLKLPKETSSSGLLSRSVLTPRSKIFLRTLSENPLQYDFFDNEEPEEQIGGQDVRLVKNPLNEHRCCATLTATLCHLVVMPVEWWQTCVVDVLLSDEHQNVKWLVAQAICNAKEELTSVYKVICPGLLAVVADTAYEESGKKLLNALHINILDTLAFWGKDVDIHYSTFENINKCIEYLITTCLNFESETQAYKYLLELLDKLLKTFSPHVKVCWSIFDAGFVTVTRLASHRVKSDALLAKILVLFESSAWDTYRVKLAKLLANALLACSNEGLRNEYLSKYKEYLMKLRSVDISLYVRLMHASQQIYTRCCSFQHFRQITDLTTKIVGKDKDRCLEIMAVYLSNLDEPSTQTNDMFQSIELTKLLTDQYTVSALQLVKSGIHVMQLPLKKKVVMQIVGHCHHTSVKIRGFTYEIMLGAHSEFPITQDGDDGPSSKKKRISTSEEITTEVYERTVNTCLGFGAVDPDPTIRMLVRQGIADKLNCSVANRFTKSFLMIMNLPITYNVPNLPNNKTFDVCESVSALFTILLHKIRGEKAFRKAVLRAGPRQEERSSSTQLSKFLTRSASYQGTFKSSVAAAPRKNSPDVNKHDLDRPIAVSGILQTIMATAELSPEVSEALLLEVTKSIKNDHGSAAFVKEMLHLMKSLLMVTSELTPVVMEMCRMFLKDNCSLDGLKEPVDHLKYVTICSEGESRASLLHEEFTLRCGGEEQFALGSTYYGDVSESIDNTSNSFTIEDMVATFGKLSNWDQLTEQKKKLIRPTLPPIWTTHDDFSIKLGETFTYNNWLKVMRSALRVEDEHCALKWLRDAEKWPKRQFVLSAITESMHWNVKPHVVSPSDVKHLPNCIQPRDCLAEWAARIMIRMEYFITERRRAEEPFPKSTFKLLRRQEYQWCEVANSVGLHRLVMQCVERNWDNMETGEKLAWFVQKAKAQRSIALEEDNLDSLKSLVQSFEPIKMKYVQQTNVADGPDAGDHLTSYGDGDFYKMYQANKGSSEVIINLGYQNLLLRSDVNSLKQVDLEDLFMVINKCEKKVLNQNLMVLSHTYELAMKFYSREWEHTNDKSVLLVHMSEMLKRMADVDPQLGVMFLDVLLDKVDNLDNPDQLSDEVVGTISENLVGIQSSLDEVTQQELQKRLPRLSTSFMSVATKIAMNDCKKCLQLICDPEKMLLHYCLMLKSAQDSNDLEKMKLPLFNIREKIFFNGHIGNAFQVLMRHKHELSHLWELVLARKPEAVSAFEKTNIRALCQQLESRPAKETLCMSDLCPQLTALPPTPEWGWCLGKLLSLPEGVTVLKFSEKVTVFTNSIRRPALFEVYLSNGTKRSYLIKNGESLKVDQSAQRVVHAAGQLWGRVGFGTVRYEVTPLDEDCGLIEFLPDHSVLKNLVKCDTHGILNSVGRLRDDALILNPNKSLQQYTEICSKIPASIMRSSMESESSSIQDFITKKQRFLDTLCPMTILIWILGLGDRHLENIIYSKHDFGVVCVDWNAVFQYGKFEMPPARLTRNLVAVCDKQALESRLQHLFGVLRDSSLLFLASMKISFKWMDLFNHMVPHIAGTLQGKTLCCDVTKTLVSSNHVQLLEKVFEDIERKDSYSVEEQVSCLLRQCTDPQILSVTRNPWEPWF